ncbi:MAG TPA: hypothetical protein VIQ54_02950 [Polyangia bacterium]
MNGGSVSAALPLLALAAVGCGGSSGGATCGTQPCGGDPIGSWTITDGCANADVAASELMTIIGGPCPGLRVDAITNEQSGTFTFNADLTFNATASITGTITATIPTSCFDNMPCTALETFLGMEGLLVQGCTGMSSCTCAIDRVPQIIDGAGTYTIADDLLMLQPAGAPIFFKNYCVSGSTMHLTGTSGSTIVDDVGLVRVTR